MASENTTRMRDTVRAMLRTHVPEDEDGMVEELERGIYNWAIERANQDRVMKNWSNPRFAQLYAGKARSVVVNLDPDSYVGNQRLRERLLQDREVPADRLAHLPPENVFPERWRECLDMKLRRDEHVFEEKPEAMTDQYKCGKCKKRETIYQELQLRSADEPMSLFITCLNCGHRWRMG